MRFLSQSQIESLIVGAFSLRLLSIIAFGYPAMKATSIERTAALAFVFIFILVLIKKFLHREPFRFHWLAVFLGYLLLSTLLHHGLKNALTVRGTDYPFHFFCLFLVMTEIKSEKTFLLILKLFVLVGAYEALLGISQVFTGYPVYHHLIHAGEEGFSSERNYFAYFIPGLSKNTVLASGTFHHFNEFGLFLVMNIGIAYGLFLHYRTLFWRILVYVIFFGIVCAFSRGSLLSSLLCLSFIYFNVTKNPLPKLVFAVSLLALFYIASKTVLANYLEETQNADVRYDTWVFAYNHCIRHPINLVFGYGLHYLKDSVLIQASMIYSLQEDLIMSNVHSSHIQIFLEQGIVGSLIFYTALSISLFYLARSRTIWGICLVGLSIGYLLGEIFEHFLIGRNGFWYFSLFGLISSNTSKRLVKTLSDYSKSLHSQKA
ncbi:MAG: hypothetical protein OHK0053_31690 [Microscillaceae bacterium]